jgi:ribonuclease VapC
VLPISVWETLAGLCHSYTFSVPAARDHVKCFLDTLGFEWVSIGVREYNLALDAYARYGKERHPAMLNMGDCFAYTCARSQEAMLWFKGNEFTKTHSPSRIGICPWRRVHPEFRRCGEFKAGCNRP